MSEIGGRGGQPLCQRAIRLLTVYVAPTIHCSKQVKHPVSGFDRGTTPCGLVFWQPCPLRLAQGQPATVGREEPCEAIALPCCVASAGKRAV